MRCLVTGGAGFIGSHIVGRLLRDDHEVVVIDDESAETNEFFNWYDDYAENHTVDITDIDACRPLFKGVDVVFHLAAKSRIQLTMNDPFGCMKTNVLGTLNMLELSREAGVQRFINSSTSSSYGLNNVPPLEETMPTDCLNPYSASKVSAETYCYMYYRLHHLRTITLRYFNVYGPREPLSGPYAPVVGLFKRQKEAGEPMTIVGDGNQRRDFTHVSDVVDANIAAMMTNYSGICVNIGSGVSYSVNDIAKAISNNHHHIPVRPGEARETLANIERARIILDWEPKENVIDWIHGQK